MKTSSNKAIKAGYEPIAGYVLEEIIGRGGYGEVWRAIAPGGINKAVKFVYGNRDEERAEQELKSLERIKGVHHPFILSLERFDIVDDRLVIVTEFADGSLEDVFKEHQSRGSCGMPRKTLLSHMSDTADALDYLHGLYKLQHLDIKPANLLMIGGRVKVADFGLLKDLKSLDQSIVGGLTPIYAPPELFDGRPSMNSDQYSLAVMYQELLTGTRPFSGRTIAQLATQHVYNAPNLTPLPPQDRGIIAKALEKSPERRFETCTEFVDALRGFGNSVSVSVPESKSTSLEVTELPAFEPKKKHTKASGARRALVVGLGGTGMECIGQLREQVLHRSAMSPLALHSVAIDIDRSSALAIPEDVESDFLPYHETITTPLKAASEYRSGGTDHLRSVSRRWIYNVPKSHKTEGVRPLGRLALLDHADRVTEKFTEAVQQLAASSEETPSVYVVASLAGGTGSGMLVDVACLLRNLLDQNGLHEAEILPLVSTVKIQGDPKRPLALPNTTAALEELAYFVMLDHGYPGDSGAKWKSVPTARSPLANTYLFATSSIHGAPRPVEAITDYLWADATYGSSFLDRARETPKNAPQASASRASVRSAGIMQLGSDDEKEHQEYTIIALESLLRTWLGNPAKPSPKSQRVVQRLLRRSRLSCQEFYEHELDTIEGDARKRRALLASKLRRVTPTLLQNDATALISIKEILKNMMAERRSAVDIPAIMSNVTREIVVCISDSSFTFASAIGAMDLLITAVETMVNELIELTARAERQSPKVVINQHNASINTSNRQTDWLDQMRPMESEELKLACANAQIQLETMVGRESIELARELLSQLNAFKEQLSAMATGIAKTLRVLSKGKRTLLREKLGAETAPLLSSLHDMCLRPFAIKPLAEGQPMDQPAQLIQRMSQLAFPLVSQAVTKANGVAARNAAMTSRDVLPPQQSVHFDTATRLMSYSTPQNEDSGPTIQLSETPDYEEPVELTAQEIVAAARPPLLDAGGAQRRLLFASSDQEADAFGEALQPHCNGELVKLVSKDAKPVLIHEAQQIDIANLVSQIRTASGEDPNLAKKLKSRADIDWD